MSDLVLDSIWRIRDRTAMYIGSRTAEAMFSFLVGYAIALHDHTEIDLTPYEEFIESLY